MTFGNIKIGTTLYEVVAQKGHFDIVERVVRTVEYTEKKVIFSLVLEVPNHKFKDWIYHIYKEKTMLISRQNFPIFVNKYEALIYLKDKIQAEMDYLVRRSNALSDKNAKVNNMLMKEFSYRAKFTFNHIGSFSTYEYVSTDYDNLVRTLRDQSDTSSSSPIVVSDIN